MDKNKIKSFAIWARRNLISAVTERAKRIGVTENKIEEAVAVQGGFKLEGNDEIFKLSKKDRDKLKDEIREKGFEQVMEEVAYTWFNRFMGLRYMEVNDYLPSGIRVLSSEVEGKTEPDVLTRVSEVIDELNLNADYIYELLDSGKTEDREEAYKHILVKQCNELGKIIPQMFEKISDYTELLLPDNLLEEGSVIRKMVEVIEESDWKEEVEIIGWMYQYYISEKKDEVFAALKKNVKITKENIPAATQLFTPKWIVKYMVENSLGRIWLEGHPNEELQKEWKYYLEEAEQESDVEEELKKIREEHSQLKPEDIKVLDPCMGSGHILVYAFDVLYEIYKTAGYSEREIPRMILQNNLYGLDIDDRAAQLASFALIMKARHYNRRLFREIERESLDLNLCSIQESNSIHKEAIDYFCSLETGLDNDELENDLEYLWSKFMDAKEYGSILEVEEVNLKALKQRLWEIEQEDNLMFGDYRKMLLDKLPTIIKQADIISKKYQICITNPPYMGRKGMSSKLIKIIDKEYSTVKSDLYAVFMKRIPKIIVRSGYLGMINQHSWMFLSTFNELREDVINSKCIKSLVHLGTRAFDDIGGEVVQTVAFVFMMNKQNNYVGSYVRLVEENNSSEKEKNFFNKKKRYCTKQEYFKIIPDSPITYWVNKNLITVFQENESIGDTFTVKAGIRTGTEEKFLRLWHEVEVTKIGLQLKIYDEILKSNKKWFPINKGGSFRKWYGNNEYVINYKNNGEDIIKNNGDHRLREPEYYFKEGITWSKISTGKVSFRMKNTGKIYGDAGSMIFIENNNYEYNYLSALLNSTSINYILQLINPTLNYPVSYIQKIPYISLDKTMINNTDIMEMSGKNIEISKEDWNSFETSWNFKVHPLLKLLDKGEKHNLSAIFRIWETECEENFSELKKNEEELNRIFIDIYGLQDELTPKVEDKDITIRKADRERDIKSFISYAVGCMLGRYSINAEGLIYAGGEFKDKWDLEDKKVRNIEKDEDGKILSDSWVDAIFLPDSDNVIPITEDEYFEDDIVSRFIDFVRIVYGNENLEENLDFIADSIGRKPSETARQAIRRYFIKDFYKDHLKVYQKRPIYWMFESGKNDGFKALVYMHRYNEQTVAKVRTDYLHTLQRKYEAEIQRQQLIVDSEEYAAKDRTAAKKKIDRISKQIEECREYDQVVAHLANEKISIDLDDGVKVNYEKFQGVKVINSKGKEVKMDLLVKI
ncbi:BREX-1 system adenine-specific DNA-methyltransferase PglX [Clostridium beijerinckii]|uniref:site-specific DNA-methyltransferase (adenine-specific) n=1 Tax=Clostridium beijerinckii TaxID=1520 RepID=A0AAW3W7B3_CLOBE|nr:BREX-1 system adenine-specific DNA-methyltransferase PglX [Clostridium beijerinckii]MBC2457312.1 BREX-1 system adenine-specific DNA-methyltransferase PglX [Clostridium beijerinckii]MBC2474368.1 BREX-1 system adenine-specific DNA-methyltransferase PglX [Clostridium beijerinckii]NOV58996.1 type II restriction/modification system DNA methylase subunit YeeA [Clostridium beijerinckii]NOV71616.1 type II restriction/modification system DNA methylase subunit YeeA [Clostridium beijerinckii]NOW32351.